jgi:hypothetical protein
MINVAGTGVAVLDAGALAGVAGGSSIDWGKVALFVYGELDDFVDGFRAGYAAAAR